MAVLVTGNWAVNPQVTPPVIEDRPPITSSVIAVVPQEVTRPALRVWTTDSSFDYDMEFMRISGPDDETGVRSDYTNGYYSFWNWSKDGTYFKQLNSRILNGSTFEFIKTASLPSSGRTHFSNLDDNKMFVLGDNKIAVLNIATNVRTTIYEFTSADGWDRSGADGSVSTDSEGTIDMNDKYIVVKMLKSGVAYRVLFDLQLGSIVAMRTDAQLGGGTIDSVKISKSGDYILVNKVGVGKLMYLRSAWATANGSNYISNCGIRSHLDFAFDSSGREVLTTMGNAGYVDILTGTWKEFTSTTDINNAFGGAGKTGGMSSGQFPSGEGIFGFHTMDANYPYIMSAKLTENGNEIRKWIHPRRGLDPGGNDPGITPTGSRDGKMICFTTNFNDGGPNVTCIVRRKTT